MLNRVTAYVEPIELEAGVNFRLILTVSVDQSNQTAKVDDLSVGTLYPTKSAVREAIQRTVEVNNIDILESQGGVVRTWDIAGEFRIEELVRTNMAMKQQGDK
jgi:hypothetical protein